MILSLMPSKPRAPQQTRHGKYNRPAHVDCHILQCTNTHELDAALDGHSTAIVSGVITGWLHTDPILSRYNRAGPVTWLLRFDPNRPAAAHFHKVRPQLLAGIKDALSSSAGSDVTELVDRHNVNLRALLEPRNLRSRPPAAALGSPRAARPWARWIGTTAGLADGNRPLS